MFCLIVISVKHAAEGIVIAFADNNLTQYITITIYQQSHKLSINLLYLHAKR